LDAIICALTLKLRGQSSAQFTNASASSITATGKSARISSHGINSI